MARTKKDQKLIDELRNRNLAMKTLIDDYPNHIEASYAEILEEYGKEGLEDFVWCWGIINSTDGIGLSEDAIQSVVAETLENFE